MNSHTNIDIFICSQWWCILT